MVESGEAKPLVPRTQTGQDQAVMDTSNDALTTKVYAEKLGYFQDEFAGLFSRNRKKMFPIINRGTWARVHSVRQVLARFLAAYKGTSRVNVLSLGAGYDSTYFWLKKTNAALDADVDYVEIDFPQVVKRKASIIREKAELSGLLGQTPDAQTLSDAEVETAGYKLLSADVRDAEIIKQKLTAMGVDGALPTLVITECLLIYMRSEDTQGVLQWTKDYFGAAGDLAFVNYEMINPNDQFGRMMVENLENRGCQLLGIHDCPSLDSQKQRMVDLLGPGDLLHVESLSMNTVYAQKLNGEGERTRIERIEMFDEFEEWELLQSHYCLTLAVKLASEASPLKDTLRI